MFSFFLICVPFIPIYDVLYFCKIIRLEEKNAYNYDCFGSEDGKKIIIKRNKKIFFFFSFNGFCVFFLCPHLKWLLSDNNDVDNRQSAMHLMQSFSPYVYLGVSMKDNGHENVKPSLEILK